MCRKINSAPDMKLGIKLFAIGMLVLLVVFLYIHADRKAHRVPVSTEGATFLLPEGWKILSQENTPQNDFEYGGTNFLSNVPDPKYTVLLNVIVSREIKSPEYTSPVPVIESLPNGASLTPGGCAPGTCFYVEYKNMTYGVMFGLPTVNGVDWDMNAPVLPDAPTGWTNAQMMSFLESFQTTK